ncbi:hypothetical protein [Haloferula sp.]|uniref:hypothetical protein n=1 Tax=Haloferula sp. TaxID=2497595 RepID=UPI003C71750E
MQFPRKASIARESTQDQSAAGHHDRISAAAYALQPNIPGICFTVGIVFSCVLILATIFQMLDTTPATTSVILNRFSLARENNIGSWWSGTLLALGGIYAFDGFALLRKKDPAAAKSWLFIGVLLIALSADEVGSIHERQSKVTQALGLGTWLVRIPVGLFIAGMLAKAMLNFWKSPHVPLHTFVLMFIGFGMMGTVPFQELLEGRLPWDGQAVKALRTGLEEGTEVLSMLILMRGCMTQSCELALTRAFSTNSAFTVLRKMRFLTPIVALVIAPLLALFTASLGDQNRGRPSDWFASLTFLAAGLVLIAPAFRRLSAVSWQIRSLATVCFLASLMVVSINPVRVIMMGETVLNLRMVLLASFIILGGLIRVTPDTAHQRILAPVIIATMLLAMAALAPANLALSFLMAQWVGLLIFWNCSKESQRDETKDLLFE